MNKFLNPAALILSLLFASQTLADLSDEMDGWITNLTDESNGLMGNATAPTAAMNASRGVVSGGGISVRSRIKPINPITVQMPSIRAGCGGIDLYGGSFSFISKDEFVAIMRAIGQNAVGYAFQLAFESICGTCMDNIKKLQNTMNQIMSDLNNSCQAAKWAVDKSGLKKSIQSIANKKNEDIAIGSGAASDNIEASNTSVSGVGSSELASTSNPAESEKLNSNIVWQALTATDFDSTYIGGDADLRKAVMSLFGTWVINAKKTTEEGEDYPHPENWAPTLTVAELFEGNQSDGKITMYTCPDGEDKNECTDRATSDVTFKGIKVRVREIMIGPGVGTSGIVEKWARNTGSLTSSEEAFLALANIPGAQLSRITRISEDLARVYADEVAGDIAINFLDFFIRKVTKHLEDAISNSDHPAAGEMLDEIKERSIELSFDIADLRKRYPGTVSEIIDKGNKYLGEMQAVDLPKGKVNSQSN